MIYILLILLTGCSSYSQIEYYENGNVKSETKKEGWDFFSDAEGKRFLNPTFGGK